MAVVNWRRPDLTVRAVRAVLADIADDDRIDVVVVDNGSGDDSVAVLQEALPNTRVVVRSENGGFAAGVNAGLAATDADAIVLLNNDAVPAAGFVRALRAHLEAAPDDVAAVTGRIVLAGRWVRADADGSGRGATGHEAALTDHDGHAWVRRDDGDLRLNSTGVRVDASGNGYDRDWFAPADTPAAVPVFGFSGGASILRRAALEDVGLLDESLFMYYEDTELSWRLARRGWRVEHAADAVVEHEHSSSSGVQSELFVFHNARNRIVVALWHAPVPAVARAASRTLVRTVRLLASAATRAEGRVVARALVDVLRHLPRHLVRRLRESACSSVPRSAVDTSR